MTTFLDSLPLDEQRRLREHGTVRRFAKGAALFHVGQEAGRALVLLSGHVKLLRVTDEGRDVVLAVRGPGDLIGEQSALDGEPRSASAMALEPVEAIALAPADFRGFVTRVPEASLYVMQELSRRLRDADRKRVEFATQDGTGRLAARLVELCERFGVEDGGGVRIDLPLTQEDLASWTASSREGVTRALAQLRSLGWVTTARRSIVVHDVDALRRRAAA